MYQISSPGYILLVGEINKLKLLVKGGALPANKVNALVKTAKLMTKCKFHCFSPASSFMGRMLLKDVYVFLPQPLPELKNKNNQVLDILC